MNTQDRLKEASDRTIEIYTHVGYLSTHFAGLELTLLKLTAKLTNPGEPEHEETNLSQLSFSQTVKKFKENAKKLLPDSEAVTKAKVLAKRLLKQPQTVTTLFTRHGLPTQKEITASIRHGPRKNKSSQRKFTKTTQ